MMCLNVANNDVVDRFKVIVESAHLSLNYKGVCANKTVLE